MSALVEYPFDAATHKGLCRRTSWPLLPLRWVRSRDAAAALAVQHVIREAKPGDAQRWAVYRMSVPILCGNNHGWLGNGSHPRPLVTLAPRPDVAVCKACTRAMESPEVRALLEITGGDTRPAPHWRILLTCGHWSEARTPEELGDPARLRCSTPAHAGARLADVVERAGTHGQE